MASMSDDEERRPDSEAEIEREIRQGATPIQKDPKVVRIGIRDRDVELSVAVKIRQRYGA